MIKKDKLREISFRERRRALVFILLAAFIAGVGQLTWKWATLGAGEDYLSLFISYRVYLGMFFYVMATGFMLLAFRYGELSVLYPILATSYIWTTLFSTLLFEGEVMTQQKFLGVCLIFVGACCISLGHKKRGDRIMEMEK